jgi:hypothetical protein
MHGKILTTFATSITIPLVAQTTQELLMHLSRTLSPDRAQICTVQPSGLLSIVFPPTSQVHQLTHFHPASPSLVQSGSRGGAPRA